MLLGVLLPSALRGLSSQWPLARSIHILLSTALKRLLEHKTLLSFFVIGIVNGFLPCGFLYIALAGAATLGEVTRGVLFLAGFGAGTLPIMLGVGFLGRPVQAGVRRRITRFFPIATMVLAVLFILRGLNLGIPYLSPRTNAAPTALESVSCHGD
jgi:sulfite exporter TauE/SafE